MQHIAINDPHDPRLSPYLDIRERDLAGRENRFVAEGKVVLSVLFSARRFDVESVLVLENRLAGLTNTLALAPFDLPVYVVPDTVMDRVVGFNMHRGVLAIGRRREPETASELLAALPDNALVVALSGISNHDNVGAIFRNAAAFGADAVLLDSRCCDPLYRKSIRVSVGAALKIPFATNGSDGDMVDALAASGFSVIALSPAGQSTIRDIPPNKRTALLVGTEGDGLSPALMARLQTARIPMVEDFDSLNVATAAAIALYELSAAGRREG